MSLLADAGIPPEEHHHGQVWREYWKGMPEFRQEDITPWKTLFVKVKEEDGGSSTLKVHFANRTDLRKFSKAAGVHADETTSEVWWPGHGSSKRGVEAFSEELGCKIMHGKWTWYPAPLYEQAWKHQWCGGESPHYPLYIPSKGRAQFQLTSEWLSKCGVIHTVIVEEQEAEEYEKKKTRCARILVLDPQFQDDYPTLDDLGRSKSLGPGPARNFAWAHSIEQGADWHWVMDDNITSFYRLWRNQKNFLRTGAHFRAMEAFVERYTNITMAGPHYEFFVPRRQVVPPVYWNTRIYSCNLIRNDVPFRWRGRYNEDTILSLDMLEEGCCTALFTAFLQKKMATQRVRGGNTDEFYRKEGTAPKSRMLWEQFPHVTELTEKWGRAHHHVDYSIYETRNVPELSPGITLPLEDNEFGMERRSGFKRGA